MIKGEWATDEVDTLIEHWGKKTAEEIALMLGRTKKAVEYKSFMLQQAGKIEKTKSLWPQEDIAYLVENWSRMSASKIGEHLEKSRGSIIGKANRLGLRKDDTRIDPPRPHTSAVRGNGGQSVKLTYESGHKPLPQTGKPAIQPLEGGVSLMELEAHHCRFPLWEWNRKKPNAPLPAVPRYCGVAMGNGGWLPYCEAHLRISTMTASKRW